MGPAILRRSRLFSGASHPLAASPTGCQEWRGQAGAAFDFQQPRQVENRQSIGGYLHGVVGIKEAIRDGTREDGFLGEFGQQRVEGPAMQREIQPVRIPTRRK